MSSSTNPELLIQVNTDVTCPWCYIGSKRLEEVLQSSEFQEEIGKYVTPRVEILPYILDSRLPGTSFEPPDKIYEKGEHSIFPAGRPPTKTEYYSKKFPTPGQLESFEGKINAEAKALGLGEFQFEGQGKVGATWAAQRLISKAGLVEQSENTKAGVQKKLAYRLYDDFHVKSLDMSDYSVLSSAAVDFGLFPTTNAAEAWLKTDDEEMEVKNKLLQAEMNGVQSIPFYNVNDGADHLSQTGTREEFMRMFKMAAQLYM